MRLVPLLLLGYLLANSAHAVGVLRLSNSEITIGGPEPAGRLEAENVGDSPLYLDITQELVQLPVTNPEIRIPLGHIDFPSLLVSPPRLVLRPGQKQVLNVKVLRQPKRRKIWRVTFRPRENISVQGQSDAGPLVPLSVSIGYGVVIYQQGSE